MFYFTQNKKNKTHTNKKECKKILMNLLTSLYFRRLNVKIKTSFMQNWPTIMF